MAELLIKIKGDKSPNLLEVEDEQGNPIQEVPKGSYLLIHNYSKEKQGEAFLKQFDKLVAELNQLIKPIVESNEEK